MPPPSCVDSVTFRLCREPSPNRRLPSPSTIGEYRSTSSSTRPSSSIPCTSDGLPHVSRFWSDLSSRMRPNGSSERIVELFHSAVSSVVETTYLGIELNLSENGSPERDGQAAANPS